MRDDPLKFVASQFCRYIASCPNFFNFQHRRVPNDTSSPRMESPLQEQCPCPVCPSLSCFWCRFNQAGLSESHDNCSSVCQASPAAPNIWQCVKASWQEPWSLEGEIQDLLSKQAVSVVPPHDKERDFYSPYFLVPKKTVGYRPILDLHALYMHISHKTCCMLTIRRLLELIQLGD